MHFTPFLCTTFVVKLDKVREGESPLNNLHDLLFACSVVRSIVDVKNKVLFFFQQSEDFPLYTEAIKFFNHSESMVRIAVRTITLNVYKGQCFKQD